ncbi:MAG: hypothetical protein RJB58_1002 [Pseudomonadota bacterium]|jgi:hypothetical protein
MGLKTVLAMGMMTLVLAPGIAVAQQGRISL